MTDNETPNVETLAAFAEIEAGGGDSGHYTIKSGNLWIATDFRWFDDPDFTIKGISQDRSAAIELYRKAARRIGNPKPEDFHTVNPDDDAAKEVAACFVDLTNCPELQEMLTSDPNGDRGHG